jgi:hypothetical protein
MNPISLLMANRGTGPTPQQQRVQWFQLMGFLVITILILLDESYRTRSVKTSTSGSGKIVVVNPEQPSVTPQGAKVRADVNNLISQKRSLSSDVFGHNVSGMYVISCNIVSILKQLLQLLGYLDR